MSAQEQYQKEQNELLATPRNGILETPQGRDWYNRRADKIVEDHLKRIGREQSAEGEGKNSKR